MCVADTTANSGSPRCVAIVDDDVRIRTLLRLELEDLGAEVACYASGEEALEQVEAQRPDLVLLDVGLPGLDGLDCLGQLRARGLRARVVLMSAHWDPGGAEGHRAAGADGFVLKTELPALLEAWLAAPP
jgi:two-component system KDP operon response regulator KdpE